MGMKETDTCHTLDIDRHESKTLLEQGVQVVPIISRARACAVKRTNEEQRQSCQAWIPGARWEQTH